MRAILAASLLCLSSAAFGGQLGMHNAPMHSSNAQAPARPLQQSTDAYRIAGNAAYDKRDYSTAFSDYRIAAAGDDARAQLDLSGMYNQGRGVPQNYMKGFEWDRLSARQGDVLAQMVLARDYMQGNSVVPIDSVKAYKWYAVIKAEVRFGSSAYKLADAMMPALAATMNTARIAQAQQEASAWWTVHKKDANWRPIQPPHLH